MGISSEYEDMAKKNQNYTGDLEDKKGRDRFGLATFSMQSSLKN
jgi:hypothetical protein